MKTILEWAPTIAAIITMAVGLGRHEGRLTNVEERERENRQEIRNLNTERESMSRLLQRMSDKLDQLLEEKHGR